LNLRKDSLFDSIPSSARDTSAADRSPTRSRDRHDALTNRQRHRGFGCDAPPVPDTALSATYAEAFARYGRYVDAHLALPD
jgi:hypothetical protein